MGTKTFPHPLLALIAFIVLIVVGELWANAGTSLLTSMGMTASWQMQAGVAAVATLGMLILFWFAGITLSSFEKAQL